MSETNVQSSRSSRTVEEILGVHPIDNDDFWGNNNPTDVLIDTANSEEMMAGSHIAEFHASKQEEPVTTELLNKALDVPEVTCKHVAGGGHHNQNDPRSAKSTDYKPNTCKNDSFSSNTVGKKDIAKVMGRTINMVEGFINDMLPKSSYLQDPTIVKDSNKTTNINEMGDLDPTAIDKNNNNSVERTNAELEANNSLGAHIPEEKDEWLYQCANNYDMWNSDSYSPKKGMEIEAPTHLPAILMFSTLPKSNITGSQKHKL